MVEYIDVLVPLRTTKGDVYVLSSEEMLNDKSIFEATYIAYFCLPFRLFPNLGPQWFLNSFRNSLLLHAFPQFLAHSLRIFGSLIDVSGY